LAPAAGAVGSGLGVGGWALVLCLCCVGALGCRVARRRRGLRAASASHHFAEMLHEEEVEAAAGYLPDFFDGFEAGGAGAAEQPAPPTARKPTPLTRALAEGAIAIGDFASPLKSVVALASRRRGGTPSSPTAHEREPLSDASDAGRGRLADQGWRLYSDSRGRPYWSDGARSTWNRPPCLRSPAAR